MTDEPQTFKEVHDRVTSEMRAAGLNPPTIDFDAAEREAQEKAERRAGRLGAPGHGNPDAPRLVQVVADFMWTGNDEQKAAFVAKVESEIRLQFKGAVQSVTERPFNEVIWQLNEAVSLLRQSAALMSGFLRVEVEGTIENATEVLRRALS